MYDPEVGISFAEKMMHHNKPGRDDDSRKSLGEFRRSSPARGFRIAREAHDCRPV
jgi:hypothetical protein